MCLNCLLDITNYTKALKLYVLHMYVIIVLGKKIIKFHSHVRMDIMKLVHFVTFRSPLKYISCYEMAWKLALIVHQHVIEF